MMDLSSKFIHSTHPWGSLFRKWNVFREVCSHINIYLLCVSTMDEFSPRKIGGSSFRLVCVKGCVELERSRITRERKELNGNPFSSVYDSRCYELWRRERNVYLLASRCSNLEEWLIVLFLQTMYLAPLGIFSPWDVLWPCFILLFRTPSSSFDIVFSFAMYYKVSWIIFSDLWVLATMINFLVRKNVIISRVRKHSNPSREIFFTRKLFLYILFDHGWLQNLLTKFALAFLLYSTRALLHPWARCVVQFCGFLHASSSPFFFFFFFFPSWFSSGLDRVRGQISAVAGPQPVRWLAIITT